MMNQCEWCREDIPNGHPSRPRRFCNKVHAALWQSRFQILQSEDIDEVVVDRLIHGECHDPLTQSNKAERMEATRTLLRKGWSSSHIADYLHITERSVDRYRDDLKKVA